MHVVITHTGIELTEAIKAYVNDKIGSIDKYLRGIERVEVEVGKQNGHHKGDVFFCRARLDIGGRMMPVERESDDLYKAIDEVHDVLREQLSQEHKRQQDYRNVDEI